MEGAEETGNDRGPPFPARIVTLLPGKQKTQLERKEAK